MEKRIKWLDGIRGIMAVNVILNHFVCIYFPQMYFGEYAEKMWGGVVACSPLSALVNGSVAVIYFFILSGFLTAMSVFGTREKWSAKKIIIRCGNRYLRLLPMVFMATLITAVFMSIGAMHHMAIAEKVTNTKFLSGFCNFSPTVSSVIYNSFCKTFLYSNDYVGPFWTIKFEFIGFIMSLLICVLLKEKKYRRILYPIIGIVVCRINVYYLFFIFGILLADLYYYTDLNSTYFSKYYFKIIKSKLFMMSFGIIGLFLFCFPTVSVGIYEILEKVPIVTGTVYRGIGAAMLLYVIMNVKVLQRPFENRCIQWLGKVSFSTYSFHWLIMLSIEAYLFDIISRYMIYEVSAVVAFILTLPIIYVVSYLAWKYIEKSKYQIKIKE